MPRCLDWAGAGDFAPGKDAMAALPRWRGGLQNAFHQLLQCNVSGALRPKSATSPRPNLGGGERDAGHQRPWV